MTAEVFNSPIFHVWRQ